MYIVFPNVYSIRELLINTTKGGIELWKEYFLFRKHETNFAVTFFFS